MKGHFLFGPFIPQCEVIPMITQVLTKRMAIVASTGFVLLTFLPGTLWCQFPTPDAGVAPVALIPVPNWTATGTVSFDLSTFNPLTRVLYYADRNNHGATAIDTKSNTI